MIDENEGSVANGCAETDWPECVLIREPDFMRSPLTSFLSAQPGKSCLRHARKSTHFHRLRSTEGASGTLPTNRSWQVDETYLCVKGRWVYLYRAIDSTGATIDF